MKVYNTWTPFKSSLDFSDAMFISLDTRFFHVYASTEFSDTCPKDNTNKIKPENLINIYDIPKLIDILRSNSRKLIGDVYFLETPFPNETKTWWKYIWFIRYSDTEYSVWHRGCSKLIDVQRLLTL